MSTAPRRGSEPTAPRRRPEPVAPLGGLSVDDFMRRHWQRRPLLIRQAIPGFAPPLDPAQLVALAADDAVESRLVMRRRSRWSLAHGPFEADEIPSLKARDWTLLVQGVDLHSDAAHGLLARFRFVPDARLDDLMISLAGDGGGVGPHVDSYDVFLLQAWGRRRWRIGPVRKPRLVPGLPLKILDGFEPDEEWLLEPGDMLYLPPGWGHDGIAEGPCMTCSIGFRAPSRHEFLAAFLAEAADAPGGPDPRFGDRGRAPTATPARLPDDLAATLSGWARDWRPDPARVDEFVGRYLTEPKPSVWFEPPAPMPLARFVRAARRNGLRLDRRSRMLWRGARLYINGEAPAVPRGALRLLRSLAESRRLDARELSELDAQAPIFGLLHAWREAGWIADGAEPSGRSG
ncbi:JmjC domain-containing protein [Zeimonas sediminis]|uniref:ribosomal protein uL16 3-hydroxylase n=1 Tax=Zeimonas sediminis TaxID=2944268 RepID=UPI003AF0DB21